MTNKDRIVFMLFITIVVTLLTFLISWLVAMGLYLTEFILTTEYGTYNELNMPKSVETYYSLLSAGLGAIVGLYITIPVFFITLVFSYLYYKKL